LLIINLNKIFHSTKLITIFAIIIYIMIIINVTKEKSIDTALRTYKQKVQKTRQLQDLKNRKEYIKPSVEKRDSKLRAIYSEKIKNGLK